MRGLLIAGLLVLMIIVTILTGFFNKKKSVVQQMIRVDQKTDTMLFETDMQHIKNALNSFFSDRGRFPESLEELVPVYLKTEKEQYDPWGTPYQVDLQDENNITIISAGKDRIFETPDDLKRRL